MSFEITQTDPKQYVPCFCSELGISTTIQQKANEIIDTTTEQELTSGKSPTGYAAAIYAASLLCNEQITQTAVASVVQVIEVSIPIVIKSS